MNEFGKKALQFGLICLVLWVGFHKAKENWPTISPEEVAASQHEAAAEKIAQSPKVEEFTLYPGQNRVVVTNHKHVVWMTSGGPAVVRERNRSCYRGWKEDLPDGNTSFDWHAADAIEFFVPPDFPGPVTYIVTVQRS